MSEHMITTLTIFQQRTLSGKYENTKKVDVVLQRTGENKNKAVEAVQCSFWSKGPRGGYTSGMTVGFTLKEFEDIHTHVAVLNYGLGNGTYETMLNIDTPWNSDIRCNRCNATIDSSMLMRHRQTEQHKQASGTLSA